MEQSVLIVAAFTEERTTLQKFFHDNGFKTWAVEKMEEALKLTTTFSPDVIIVDIDSKNIGLDFCRTVRNVYSDWTPIVLLSSRNEELDAVLGLELGADDYVFKPLRYKELHARVKSILRRGSYCCDYKNSQNNGDNNKFINGNLMLDANHFMVYNKGEPVDLTRKEYELLYYLFLNKGKVLTRMELMKELSGESDELDERIIDVFISRIRTKIEPSRKNPIYLKTVRNLGYMMKDIRKSSISIEKEKVTRV
ncbi:response regulator transcription factor [Evansella cellulosilytica]|uniref:Two component transcriptional regulator, winged helix family n=1 Tax=Evansella cellulosilytica (strain ATCC 21833 / DSM 2522 / FERM P-1141 / JCM 9156 / N-4) TaxID=649639 RepID=E6TYT4_EVAC2|nr:response regulator transcription factor [Evansella cellulosilytica]ADU31269.1 two component transcriptional regulator, winged helix family [Evansella cellulosilytica DSM 2522]